MKLKWDRTTISASEVNRYTYCPYQWYFERYYGRSKLFELSKSKKVNGKQTAKAPAKTRESNFARGRAFHAQEYQSLKRKQKIVSILMVGIILVMITCFFIFLIK